MPIVVWIILAIILPGLAWFIYCLVWGTPPKIHWAVERFALQMLLDDPETLTTLGVADNSLIDFHSGSLTDASPCYMEGLRNLDREGLALIQRYRSSTLSGEEKLTYHLMRWYFENNLQGHRFDYHWVANAVFMGPYPVNHVFGVQIDLINFLCAHHKIRGRRSVRRYIKRLQMIEWKFAGLMESLNARESDGVVPPRFVIEKTLAQIVEFLAYPVEQNPLYTNLLTKIQEKDRFGEAFCQRWMQKASATIEQMVYPAYRMLQDYLEALLNKAGEDDGVWRLPNGQAYYDFLLRTHTTTDLTAEQIHQLGLEEVAQLTELIRSLLIDLDLPVDSTGRALRTLKENPAFHFTGELARDEIIAEYQGILDEVNLRLPEIFSYGALQNVVVQRLPEYKEPDSPIAYAQAPAVDGSRPGIMWVNLRDPGNVYRWGMRTLAYHEGIPGHIYQMAQAQRIRGIPTFRRAYFFNAYIEGWALYAERLCWELGLEDDLSNLGRLQGLMWRAVRLVVDTGIHAMRWTREQAIEYMTEKTGLPERDIITEVERYIVMPGQACAYYIGYQKMLALRQKAESTLGEAFNLKDFHDALISHGGLPLGLLESVVNDYLDQHSGLKSVG